MNFSEPLRASNGQSIWSSDGLLLASSCGPRLTIWDAASLDVLQVYTCMDNIDKIEFSPDGDFLLAAVFKTGETVVFCVNQPDYLARIQAWFYPNFLNKSHFSYKGRAEFEALK